MKYILYILFILTFSFSFGQEFTGDVRDEIILEKWNLKQIDGEIELSDVIFPNTIHEILFEKGKIEDPYFGNNEKKLQWIEESDWEVSSEFKIEEYYKENVHFITFKSIEPFAKVYLNNNFLFESKNAFIPYQIDITKQIQIGKVNEIKIIFESPVRRSKELQTSNTIYLPGDERVYTRKSQYEFGWDWGPRFVTSGMRDKIYYQVLNQNYCDIKNIYLNTINYSNETAEISCELEVYSNISQTRKLEIDYGNETLLSKKIKLKKGINYLNKKFIQKKPELWWPRGMGAQFTYNYVFNLSDLKNKYNNEITSKSIVYSFCDIKLVREKDSLGKSFYFTVNEKKCYLKGFNLIPEDHFKTGQTENIFKISELNANSVRIWGGGNYPTDDQLLTYLGEGILVWQDFMFAGGMYPGDTVFLKNVEEEITYQVKRLRNYNNIALYCGNNEIDEAWHNWGWQKQYNYSKEDSTKIWNDYLKLFHELIPSIVKKYDSDVDYLPSSPEIGWGRKESMTQGDSHYWGVWWGKEPIETFEEKIPRFMSEFGMQAMPDLSTLRKVVPDSLLNFNSPEFKNHQKHPTGFETLNYYLEKYLTIPSDMVDYVYATQLLQTITLEKAIKAQRMSEKCMGTLIWQLNDTWPVTSWSVIDSEGKKKLAYDYVKNSFDKYFYSLNKINDGFDLFLFNDSEYKDSKMEFKLSISSFSGKLILDTIIYSKINNGKNLICKFSSEQLKNIDLETSFLNVKSQILNSSSSIYFTNINELSLDKPELKFNCKIEDSFYYLNQNINSKHYEVNIISESYLHCLSMIDGSYNTYNNKENYFPQEIAPGEKLKYMLPYSDFINEQDAIDFVKKNLKSINHLLGK